MNFFSSKILDSKSQWKIWFVSSWVKGEKEKVTEKTKPKWLYHINYNEQ